MADLGGFTDVCTVTEALNAMRAVVWAIAAFVNPNITSRGKTAPNGVLVILFVVFMVQWFYGFASLTLISGISGRNGSGK